VSPSSYDVLHPVTITGDRYGGIYSGGSWVAFPLFPGQVPEEPGSSDVIADGWWRDHTDLPIGRGDSPDEAYQDLLRRLEAIEPTARYPQTSKGGGSLWSWEIRWPDGELRVVDRFWSGRDRGPHSPRT
jgi:hypothetical protein